MELLYFAAILRTLFIISVPVTLTVYACVAIGSATDEFTEAPKPR